MKLMLCYTPGVTLDTAVVRRERLNLSGTSLERPPHVSTKWRSQKLKRLHHSLRQAVPELRGLRPISSEDMDWCHEQCLRSTNFEDAKYWYQEANLLKRWVGGGDTPDSTQLVAEAVEKLLDANVACKYTNRVFSCGLDGNPHLDPAVVVRLKRARAIIARILGPMVTMDELFRACDFTPGATTGLRRKDGARHNKWEKASTVTFHAIPYVEAFQRWAGELPVPGWGVIQNFNKVFTVPKRFDALRTACLPNEWNGFFQKGLGKVTRRRMHRVKLLQQTAQEEHALLAKLGSATGLLTARDLKSASDTVALTLCDVLFPEWYVRLLSDFREPDGLLPDGSLVEWELLSSMGNGYTFEVETLLFYSIVKACCSKDSFVSVYGDDIIFPSQYSEKVDETLLACGFKINGSKSSRPGIPWMESCGGHFFLGRSVKPMFLQQYPTTLGDVIHLHNEIIRICEGKPRVGTRWHGVFSVCREIVPKIFWGPTGMQGCLWADWDEACPDWSSATQSWRIATVSRVSDESEDLSERTGAYLQQLWTRPGDDEANAFSEYSRSTDRERGAWAFVCRVGWPIVDRATWLCR